MRRRSSVALACVVAGAVAAGCSGSPGPSAQPSRRHPDTARRAGPGVLADCTAPAPQRLVIRPRVIDIACADAGIGAENLVWRTWTTTSATATGDVWENDCVPNCASGTIKHYPASVMLTNVEVSRQGPTFTTMTATYSGTGPNGRQTDTFALEKPLG